MIQLLLLKRIRHVIFFWKVQKIIENQLIITEIIKHIDVLKLIDSTICIKSMREIPVQLF